MPTLEEFFDFLQQKKFLSKDQFTEVNYYADQQQISLLTAVRQKQMISTEVLAYLIAKFFQWPLLDLTAFNSHRLPKNRLAEKKYDDFLLLPLYEKNKHLLLAIAEPLPQTIIDEIKFSLNCMVDLVVVNAEILASWKNKSTWINTHNEIDVALYSKKILLHAQQKNASDIHLEATEKNYRLRFRIDGILYELETIPLEFAQRLLIHWKIAASLDIAEQRLPQDGRFQQVIDNKKMDVRVSTCPTAWGEKIVLRLLNALKMQLAINALGLLPEQEKLLQQVIKKPQGLILVAGPTGSGKTITLYSLLAQLNKLTVNIVTAEDPIEINLSGINQTAVNTKAGIHFANLLRAFLRQDPDIIMVGEIRDYETAEMAIKAAQTGHLVLSTLHTNNAAAAISRLIHMGIPAYHLVEALTLIISQRLVRCLCPYCKSVEQNSIDESLLKKCTHCMQGYQGRTGIFELLFLDAEIKKIILENPAQQAIEKQARNSGMYSIQDAAKIKIQHGITNDQEVQRVLNSE